MANVCDFEVWFIIAVRLSANAFLLKMSWSLNV